MCKIDTIFVVEQLVGKYRLLWLDPAPHLKRQWLWNHLLAASSAVHHSQLRAQAGPVLCSGALSTLTLSCSFISLQGQCWACPAELLTSHIHCHEAGTRLLCPSLDYASPFLMLPLTSPQLHHSTPSFTTPIYCCLLICTRDRWHRQNSIRRCHFHKASHLPGLGNTLQVTLESQVLILISLSLQALLIKPFTSLLKPIVAIFNCLISDHIYLA